MDRKIDMTVNVNAKVKEEAQAVLDANGISMSEAVEAFLRQVVSQECMPFDDSFAIQHERPRYEEMTHAELNKEFEKAFADVAEGKVYEKEAFQALLDNLHR